MRKGERHWTSAKWQLEARLLCISLSLNNQELSTNRKRDGPTWRGREGGGSAIPIRFIPLVIHTSIGTHDKPISHFIYVCWSNRYAWAI